MVDLIGFDNRWIILPDFFGPNEPLFADQLGWQEAQKKEARSLISKKIFEHCILKVGFNLAFYYVDNDTCYGLHNEQIPIVLKILPRHCEEKYIFWQLEDDTHLDGEVLTTFWDENLLWDGIRIDDQSFENVLDRSYILLCS